MVDAKVASTARRWDQGLYLCEIVVRESEHVEAVESIGTPRESDKRPHARIRGSRGEFRATHGAGAVLDNCR